MRFHRSRARFRRRYLVIPIVLIVLGIVFAVQVNSMTQSSSQHVSREPPAPSPYCRSGNPLDGTNSLRFRVLSKCEVGSGIVESVTLQENGDQQIYVRIDAQYSKLLATGNSNLQNSFLVLERISQDQATVQVPSVGQHITFVGPWVYDTENLSNAICPVWSITPS